jgi:threonylcarbamoyladenosine tRNA methylthiotransferase MtaB
MEFTALHVFKYSPRQGTTASQLPDSVPPEVKEHRSERLIALGKLAAKAYASKFLGCTLEVIVEQQVKLNDQQVKLSQTRFAAARFLRRIS